VVSASFLHQAALALHRAGYAMYAAKDVVPAVRSAAERADPHPIYREFMDLGVSKAFSRDEVRASVIPVYMGLIKQIDDQIGSLLRSMQEMGLMQTTMIVFTSDHGDYLSLVGREGPVS